VVVASVRFWVGDISGTFGWEEEPTDVGGRPAGYPASYGGCALYSRPSGTACAAAGLDDLIVWPRRDGHKDTLLTMSATGIRRTVGAWTADDRTDRPPID
jgi:hypothetical protein